MKEHASSTHGTAPARTIHRLAFVIAAALGVTMARAESTAFDSLVAAERGFASASVAGGMRAAFLANLSDGAVVFRAGPVNGVRHWRGRGESPARLAWAPSFAEISGAGDLGFTTGPWTYAASRDTAPSAFGHFVSVWHRDGAAAWKVALDIGVSHDDPQLPLDRVTVTPGPAHARADSTFRRGWGGGFGVGIHSGGVGFGLGSGGVLSRRDYEWRRTQHAKNELMTAERTLSHTARTRGWEAAYREVAAADLRVYREGHLPELGPDAAIAASAALPTDREWQPRGNGVASSWDLGYAYGIAISRSKGARPDTASYTHLWRRDDAGAWRMMLDIENPFPRRP